MFKESKEYPVLPEPVLDELDESMDEVGLTFNFIYFFLI
jgi:hypothetical protein